MSGDYLRHGGRRAAPVLAALCIAGAVGLSGCSGFKRAIGLERASPDEFAVESRAPLTLPPDFNLRPPEPGAARPQEPLPNKQARAALDAAGPGKPGEQEPPFALRTGENGLPQTGAQGPDPNAQIGGQSLAGKLLDYGAAGDAGAAVEKRETTPLKGVY